MQIAKRITAGLAVAGMFLCLSHPIYAQGSGADLSLATLTNDIESGREISFPVKYNSYFEDSYGNSTDVFLVDGVVTLSKTTFGFNVTKSYKQSFSLSPDKILETLIQPQQASRLKVKVAIKSVRGNKEIKQDYYFYSSGASDAGSGPLGSGDSVDCSGCDGSMNVLYVLLAKFRGGQWARAEDISAPSPDSAQPAPVSNAAISGGATSVSGRYVRQGDSNDFIELGPHGVYFGQQHGKDFGGKYGVVGDVLVCRDNETGRNFSVHIIGNTLKDPNGMVWEKQADSAPSSEPAMAPIEPPPPPTDAAPSTPPTISLGQTKEQVVAILGQPQKVANVGEKEIDYYSDMKVIFIKGKVTDIQ